MICKLKYSRIPSIPLFGYCFYLFELLLIYGNLSKLFYMSSKEKKYIMFIIKLLDKKCSSFQVQTTEIGRNLLLFNKPLSLDLSMGTTFDLQNEDEYNQVLWTFVASERITSRTKTLLHQKNLAEIISSFN